MRAGNARRTHPLHRPMHACGRPICARAPALNRAGEKDGTQPHRRRWPPEKKTVSDTSHSPAPTLTNNATVGEEDSARVPALTTLFFFPNSIGLRGVGRGGGRSAGGLGKLVAAAAAAGPGQGGGSMAESRQSLPWPHAGGGAGWEGEGKKEVTAGGRVSPGRWEVVESGRCR